MARRRRIDARCDEGGGLLDERARSGRRPPGTIGCQPGRTAFTRGDGAGQHHRALSTLGIFVLMGVGGFSARGVRGSVVVGCWGFGWLLQDGSARGAADRGDVGPREGQEGEEGDGAVHGGRCWWGVGGGQDFSRRDTRREPPDGLIDVLRPGEDLAHPGAVPLPPFWQIRWQPAAVPTSATSDPVPNAL